MSLVYRPPATPALQTLRGCNTGKKSWSKLTGKVYPRRVRRGGGRERDHLERSEEMDPVV